MAPLRLGGGVIPLISGGGFNPLIRGGGINVLVWDFVFRSCLMLF